MREHCFDPAPSVAAAEAATASVVVAVVVSVAEGTTPATTTGAAETVVAVVDVVTVLVLEDVAAFVAAMDRFVTKYQAPMPIAASASNMIMTIGHLLDFLAATGGGVGY